jgi:hypothetical protein
MGTYAGWGAVFLQPHRRNTDYFAADVGELTAAGQRPCATCADGEREHLTSWSGIALTPNAAGKYSLAKDDWFSQGA